MKQSSEVVQESETPCEEKVWHQDDALGPQRRGLGVFMHSSFEEHQEWSYAFSMGMASNEQKYPLVQEIALAGTPLNDRHFIDAENLELWIENGLAGLCRYTFYDDVDDVPDPGEPLKLLISLCAVFIRPQYQSLGFGALLGEQLAEFIASGIVTRLLRRKAEYIAVDIQLTADFESPQGELFFDYLKAILEFKTELISAHFDVSTKLFTDAGY